MTFRNILAAPEMNKADPNKWKRKGDKSLNQVSLNFGEPKMSKDRTSNKKKKKKKKKEKGKIEIKRWSRRI